MPIQSRNRRQQRRRSLKIKGGEEKDIMDKLVEIEGKIDGLNTLIMQGNPAEEVPPVKEEVHEEVHDDDADDNLKTVTPSSNIDDESNNKLETPKKPENGSGTGSEMPENGSGTESEMPENGSGTGSGTGSEMPENGSGTGSGGGRRNSRRRRQRNNRKSQRRR